MGLVKTHLERGVRLSVPGREEAREADITYWENEFQGWAADLIKPKKHGGGDITWGGGHHIFQNQGKRESEGAECRVKRGHLIYWPWGKVLARPAVACSPSLLLGQPQFPC